MFTTGTELHTFPNKQTPVLQYRGTAWRSRLCSAQELSYTLSPINKHPFYSTGARRGVLGYVQHRNCYTLSPINKHPFYSTGARRGVLGYVHHSNCYTLSPNVVRDYVHHRNCYTLFPINKHPFYSTGARRGVLGLSLIHI